MLPQQAALIAMRLCLHFLAAAYHGNAGVFHHCDDIAAMLADVKLHVHALTSVSELYILIIQLYFAYGKHKKRLRDIFHAVPAVIS